MPHRRRIGAALDQLTQGVVAPLVDPVQAGRSHVRLDDLHIEAHLSQRVVGKVLHAAASAQLDETLAEIERRKVRLAGLQKLVEEGSFSRSLFDALDGEKLALGQFSLPQRKTRCKPRSGPQ
jgi:hypothetical protein